MTGRFRYDVSSEVFYRYPGYIRGVVLAFGVTNGPSPIELTDLLRQAEEDIRLKLDLDDLARRPEIDSWREAYRSFGAKPAKFRPSMEAMTRRVLNGHDLPSISRLVDIGNIISLKYFAPTGGHAIDLLKGDISLRPADGSEVFVPFGSDKPENPEPGEIIFTEGHTVLTRRWTWRQANHTLIVPETTAVEFNIDGLPPISNKDVQEAADDLMKLIKDFCGGQSRFEILSAENPHLVIQP